MSTYLQRTHSDAVLLERQVRGLRAELELLDAPVRRRIVLCLSSTAIAFFVIAVTLFCLVGTGR